MAKKVNLVGALNYVRQNLQAWCVNNFVTKESLVVPESGSVNFINYCKLVPSNTGLTLSECTNSDITVLTLHPDVTRISNDSTNYGEGVFSDCKNLETVQFELVPGASRLTEIDDYSFYFTRLKSLQLPSSLVTIGEGAFTGIDTQSVVIPDSVQVIRSSAFSNNDNLRSITIGSNVSTMEINVFRGCDNIQEVYINDLVKWFNITSKTSGGIDVRDDACVFGNGADAYVKNASGTYDLLTSLTVPSSVTETHYFTFKNCKSIQSIDLNKVQSLSVQVFDGCSSLRTVRISNTVTDIFQNPFTHCSNLESIQIDSTNEWFRVEENCVIRKKAQSIYPANELIIGCKSVTTVPSSVTSIGSDAFCGSGISVMTLPTSINSIDYGAFLDCPDLQIIKYQGSFSEWGNVDKQSGWCDDHVIIQTSDAFADADGSQLPLLQINAERRSLVGFTGEVDETLVVSPTVEYNDRRWVVESFPSAFSSCTELVSVVIPSVASDLPSTFAGCTKLKSATVPLLSDSTFIDCTSLETVTLNGEIDSIGTAAFYNCTSLKTFDVPESVKVIGNSAFKSCTELVSVTLHESLEEIGASAFYYCTSLSEISIPTTVTTIGEAAFAYCWLLSDIYYSGTKEEWGSVTKHADWDEGLRDYTVHCSDGDIETLELTVTSTNRAITGYTGTENENLTIPVYVVDGYQRYKVTAISAAAFEDCSELVSVSLPKTVEAIASNAFINATKLNAINIDSENENFKSVDGVVYSKDGTKLCCYPCGKPDTAVTVEDGITSIEERAFQSNDLIVSIVLPQTLITVASGAFMGCKNLLSIDVPDSVTSLGSDSFSGCENLQHVNLPDSLYRLEDYTFSGCCRLESITLPATLNYIDQRVFQNCHSLKHIDLPKTLTSIESYAFTNCYSLAEIELPDNLFSIASNAFRNCYSLTHVEIPVGPVVYGQQRIYLYDNVFQHCASLKSVTIPTSLANIPSAAFRGCSALETINFAGTLAEWESLSKATRWDTDTGPYSVICSDDAIVRSVNIPEVYLEEEPTTKDISLDLDTFYIVYTLKFEDYITISGTIMNTDLQFTQKIQPYYYRSCIKVYSEIETIATGDPNAPFENYITIQAVSPDAYNKEEYHKKYKVKLASSESLSGATITDVKAQSVVRAEKI